MGAIARKPQPMWRYICITIFTIFSTVYLLFFDIRRKNKKGESSEMAKDIVMITINVIIVVGTFSMDQFCNNRLSTDQVKISKKSMKIQSFG